MPSDRSPHAALEDVAGMPGTEEEYKSSCDHTTASLGLANRRQGDSARQSAAIFIAIARLDNEAHFIGLACACRCILRLGAVDQCHSRRRSAFRCVSSALYICSKASLSSCWQNHFPPRMHEIDASHSCTHIKQKAYNSLNGNLKSKTWIEAAIVFEQTTALNASAR